MKTRSHKKRMLNVLCANEKNEKEEAKREKHNDEIQYETENEEEFECVR